MNEQANPKKRRKKWTFVLGISLIPILLVLLAPAIASSSLVRNLVLARANEAVDGTVGITDWSLSWLGQNMVEGFSFTDADGRELAQARKIVLGSGLLQLIRTRDAGEVKIVEPVIVYTIPGPTAEVSETTPAEKLVEEKAFGPVELPVSANVTIVNGKVTLTPPGDQKPVTLKSLNGSLLLAKEKGAINLTLNSLMGDESAPLRATVNLAPPEGNLIDPKTVGITGSLGIEKLDLQPVLDLAARFSEAVPTGAGRLTTAVNFEASASGNASFSGHITTRALKLAGGALGDDTPDLGDIMFVFEGAKDTQGIRFKETVLRSEFANLDVSGDLPHAGTGRLNLSGEVQVAKLANALPHTLKMQEGLALKSGELKLRADLSREGQTLGVNSLVTLEDLAGTLSSTNGETKAIALDEPVKLAVKGAVADTNVEIETFDLTSAFLSGSGSGNLDNLILKFDASAEEALTEVSKFIDLGGLRAAGEPTLQITMQKTDQGERRIQAALKADRLQVARGAQMILPGQPVNVNVDLLTDITEEGWPSQIRKGELIAQSKILRGKAILAGLELPEKDAEIKSPLKFRQLAFNTIVDLGMVSDLKTAPAEDAEPAHIRGLANLSGSLAAADGGLIRSEDLNIQVKNLDFQQGIKRYRQETFTLATGADINLEKKSLVLTGLKTRLQPGQLETPMVTIGNWSDVMNTLQTSLNAGIDLAETMRMVAGLTGNEQALPVSGEADMQLSLAPAGGGGNDLSANMKVKDFAYAIKPGQVVREKAVELTGKLHLSQDQEEVAISEMRFATVPFSLSGQGKLVDLKRDGKLSAQGVFNYDLAKLAPYVKLFSGRDILMVGQAEKPFKLELPLGGDAKGLPPAYFESALSASQIKMYGLDIRNMEVPILLSDRKFSASIVAKVNDGDLALHPYAVLSGEKPVLRLPKDSQILTRVNLTDEVSNELLGKIHPMFANAAAARGKISMTMNHLSVPTAGDMKSAKFAGKVDFHEVFLGTSGMLEQVLTVVKVKERNYQIEQEHIDFSCENGRITCSPLKIRIDGHMVQMAGSVGFDQTLDYKVTVPLTDKLVSNELMKYLEGTSVDLPLTGTVSRPRLAPNGLDSVLKPLVASAVRNAANNKLKEEAGKILGNKVGGLLNGGTGTGSQEDKLKEEAGKLLRGLLNR